MQRIERVAVGLSGGVDSAVAAALLVEQGYEVVGLMLRLWVEDEKQLENSCCTPDSITLAKGVARTLGIPFYVIDARDEFRGEVVEYFLNGIKQGLTPNPCVVCNKWIRWGFLWEKARLLGADQFATGHYARIARTDGEISLRKGSDAAKDQSYVLARLNREDLTRTILPLGTWEKVKTREKAMELNLPVHAKPDSQDLCFTGRSTYPFLEKYIPEMFIPGEIVDDQGRVMGEHKGLARYTFGQRKDIRVASDRPLYVMRKDFDQNRLVVAPVEKIGRREFHIDQMNWINEPVAGSFRADVMVRYRSKIYQAEITPDFSAQTAKITAEESIPNIAPGQLAVIYQDDEVVGSGFITHEMNSMEAFN